MPSWRGQWEDRFQSRLDVGFLCIDVELALIAPCLHTLDGSAPLTPFSPSDYQIKHPVRRPSYDTRPTSSVLLPLYTLHSLGRRSTQTAIMEPASNSDADGTSNAFIDRPRPSSRLSSYTLRSMRHHFCTCDSADETSSLKGKSPADGVEGVRRYGAVAPPSDNTGLNSKETRRKLLWAGIKMAILFVVCTAALWGTLKLALPTLEE